MTGMHLTLREMQGLVTDKRTLAIALTAVMACTLAGPFGTDAAPIAFRAVYWLICIAVAMVMSTTIITGAHRLSLLDGLPDWVKSQIGAAVFSAVYAGFLVVITVAMFDNRATLPGYLTLLGYSAPIAAAVAAVVDLFRAEDDPPAADGGDDRFFKRLKPALGRDLIRLSMQDHYLEVVTAKGSQLILLRFSDALEEIGAVEGWRIHRSHWVALAGIAGVRRENGKTLIATSDGAELPVSRTYLPALRDAGVLKRFS